MSAEEVKAALRQYAIEQFGEVRSASAIIQPAKGVSPEVLHAITPVSAEPTPSESPSAPGHIRLLGTA